MHRASYKIGHTSPARAFGSCNRPSHGLGTTWTRGADTNPPHYANRWRAYPLVHMRLKSYLSPYPLGEPMFRQKGTREGRD